jgi:hypothetical protein
MQEDLDRLLSAIENSEDLGACEEIVAKNFPAFLENESLKSFPDEVLFGILSHPDVQYPDPDTIANFFIGLFDHGSEAVSMFVNLIPVDELSLGACDLIIRKLTSLGFDLEARKMERVKNLYVALEAKASEQRETGDQFTATAAQLAHSSELLDKMTALLRNTSTALKDSTEAIGRKDQELRQKDEIIAKLLARIPARR